MKKLFYLVLIGTAFWFAPRAHAWSQASGQPYLDTDALLVFRASGHNDIEFDLGNVSQFLNKANGYTVTVTNWSLAPVAQEFGADLTGVSVALLATTPKDSITPANQIAWVSSAGSVVSMVDFRNSAWQSKLWSTINSLGSKPPVYETAGTNGLVTATGNNSYSIGLTSPAAYDFIAPPSQLGGNVSFAVEQTIPGTLKLWAIHVSTLTPVPNSPQIGTFSITAGGVLTFTADNGQTIAPPAITGVSRTNGVTSVTFTTVNGGTYQLLYNSALTSPATNWPTVGATVAGDGASHTLAHTNATASGFYKVVRSP